MERGAGHPASGVHEIKRPMENDRMTRERWDPNVTEWIL